MKNAVSSIWQRLSRYFLAGVFVVLPLVLTIVLLAWLQNFLDGLVGPNTFLGRRLSDVGGSLFGDPAFAYLLGWCVVPVSIFLLGMLAEGGLKRLYKSVIGGILRRLPLIGKVYDASTQLVDMLDKQGDDKLSGMGVVYCSFGEQAGAGVLGLLPTSETISIRGQDHYVVLVPQSPVPIGGALLFMPTKSVERVDMSVDKLMAIYVSMGASAPELMADAAGAS